MNDTFSRSRRDFLRASALGLGAVVVVSTGLAGCSGSSSGSDDTTLGVSFAHGVASGDPLADRVIIWTRVTPDRAVDRVTVSWEVASDAGFSQLLHDGSTETSADHDYTVKVDVQNLLPGTTYYYRFKSNGVVSAVGKTRTLPDVGVSSVRLAVLSCANYPAGFFHAYAEAAKRDDLDAVVHLGDYIYEYGMGGYATQDAEAIGRALPADNAGEIISLGDYRKRYALYRTDPDLQALHAAAPFIVVWDDHEVANNAWRDGAENHQPSEGDFSSRKLAAIQAYFEWLPIRPASLADRETIYRSFSFGDLVDLHMLDTRLIGRDPQLDYADFMTASGFDAVSFAAALTDPDRSLLGGDQRAWLQGALASGSALWQVLGQQVLAARITIPGELLADLANPSPALMAKLGELAMLKARYLQGDPTLTPEEIARVNQPKVPYNLDAWDGYFVERELVLGTARMADKNLVVLAGDTHNAWASNLTDVSGNQVGVEFATPGVTSPGLEEYLGVSDPAVIAQAEQGFTVLADDLQYINASQRGYMVVTFTRDRVQADWHFVDTVKSRDYQVVAARGRSLEALPGAGNRRIRELSVT